MPLETPSFPQTEPNDLERRAREFRDFIALELPRQHADRVAALRKTKLLEHIPGKDDGLVLEIQEGITAFNGEHFALPSVEAIAEYWKQHEEIFALKMEQGFTRLHIVPFGYPLNYIIEKTKAVILDHAKNGTLLGADGIVLDCDTKDPLSVWGQVIGADESGDLVYDITKFDEQNHGGRTKQEILNDKAAPFPGFHVLLLQKSLVIPIQGEGEEFGGRKQLEAGRSSKEYLAAMQTDPAYAHETGLTPEDDLILMATHLSETGKMINDDGITAGNLLINSYFRGVPTLKWSRTYRQASVEGYDPELRGDWYYGCRSAVGQIKPKPTL